MIEYGHSKQGLILNPFPHDICLSESAAYYTQLALTQSDSVKREATLFLFDESFCKNNLRLMRLPGHFLKRCIGHSAMWRYYLYVLLTGKAFSHWDQYQSSSVLLIHV